MAKVTVHKFKVYDPQTDETSVSRRMGTTEAIAGVRSKPIEGTAVEIDASDLDPRQDGMTPLDYRP